MDQCDNWKAHALLHVLQLISVVSECQILSKPSEPCILTSRPLLVTRAASGLA